MQIGDLTNATINFYLEVHAPAKVIDSSEYEFEPYDENSREWTHPVDKEWLTTRSEVLYIKY